MFAKLPSLLGFQPKFYAGGPTRFHLPLFYDLVARKKPKSIVTLGFGDGQAFFTFCQAAREQKAGSQCTLIRRDRAGENAADDLAWYNAKDYGQEFYGGRARFVESSAADALNACADNSVDLLLLDDCDSASEVRADLASWEAKLSPQALILLHGLNLERADGPKDAWKEWVIGRPSVEIPDGIGLGIAFPSRTADSQESLFEALFGSEKTLGELIELYRIAVARISAQTQASQAVREQAALEARQIWLDSLLADRWKVQAIMDYQAQAIGELEQRNEALFTDRSKAQLVMDGQLEQLRHWIAESERLKAKAEQLKTQIKDQKAILNAAKQACRKNGRCFRMFDGQKERRPLAEKILREIRRLPRNLRVSRWTRLAPPPAVPNKPIGRYAAWIKEHEPDMAALEEQRHASSQLQMRPKISLLVPLYNTPARFLDEMFASVSAQTYDNWELCIVDGGSDHAETLATLKKWVSRESKIRLRRLEQNFGISENTNHALELVTGDFLACIDHDDLLAPFALYELVRAIGDSPEGDIFYSDEDRWSVEGNRHAPFFKPEWSPELLYASMYIGHLTAYRRTLVDKIGGFRKEFDLSQDYDFALRATECAGAIHHIPHVLYHWREHPASGSAGGKPDARKTNLAALADAMRRRNRPAEIIEYPAANRARLKLPSWPRVSVIIPTDSPTRAQVCLCDLPRNTKYPDLEIVIVTNSKLLESLKSLETQNAAVRLIAYDRRFNFSDKCNLGADAATGARLIFFNDDVEPEQPTWIQNVIEPLENPEVGAVAPKLLYETGKIQHAGLVLGVRGLVGTAFHQRAADSMEHFNLAQSLRDVAALSAACLAMRREDFMRLGGFDAVNTPIAHSDVDLSFRIREAGLRCVYTPYATLNHAGHVSIAVAEKKEEARRRNKASIYLLKRWGRYATHDPYFTDNMRDWLHADSPTPIRMMARDEPASLESYPDLLFISHDLSLSGAPILLLQLAIWCKQNGMFVLVVAPVDGPLREKYEAAGIPLIIDPLIMTGHESFVKLARDFDCVLANTIRSEPAVRSAFAARAPVIWWVHETQVGEHFLRADGKLRSALALADVVLAPSERTASVYRPFTDLSVKCLFYGIPDAGESVPVSENWKPRIFRFLLLGSIEPRKGQDVFLEAVLSLPPEMRQSAEFHLLGRVIDLEFGARLEAAAAGLANVFLDGPCDHGEALEAIRRSDALVCSSRDEAMPVTILEALSLGKAIVSTNVGGIGEILTDGHDALLVGPEDPETLAGAMQRLWESPALAQQLSQNARSTFKKNFTQDRFGADFRQLVAEVMARDTNHDPYIMHDRGARLYSDAPTRPRMRASDQPAAGRSSLRLLFVSHDLSLSGAPMMLLHAATWCQRNGIFVQVIAPHDGPLGKKLSSEGLPVIIDPLVETGHESFTRFARDFDCIVANTIFSAAVVRALKGENVPIVWWVHEPGSVGEHYLREDTELRATMPLASLLLAPSESTAKIYRRYTDQPVKCLRNAVPDPGPGRERGRANDTRQLRFLFLGSVEPRKGQDVFVEALALLPTELQQAAQFQIAGRVLDPDFWPKVEAVAKTLHHFSVRGALSHAEAIELMREADVVVSASRDEAMPTVTILEAMSLGKALIATNVGGAPEVLVDGKDALLVRPDEPAALSAAIRRLIEDSALAGELGKTARETYKRSFTMARFGEEFRHLIEGALSQPLAVRQAQDA
jgi:glycosyltransferase involved in cell wall biosynthesis